MEENIQDEYRGGCSEKGSRGPVDTFFSLKLEKITSRTDSDIKLRIKLITVLSKHMQTAQGRH